MKNNILDNLRKFVKSREAEGLPVSPEIKNYVKTGKLFSEKIFNSDEDVDSSYMSLSIAQTHYISKVRNDSIYENLIDLMDV